MEQKILPVKSDVIFKIFFADERNIEFLTDFLKSALQIPDSEYKELVIVDPHLIREHKNDKLGILDVKLRTVSGKTIHIEIQVKPLPYMRQRIAYYSGKLITEQIGKSEKFENINQVITILITETEFIEKSPKYHHRFTMSDLVNKVELSDICETHTLELCKIPPKADNSRLYDWMRFIKAEGVKELESVAKKDPLMNKAVLRLMELSADEKTRLLYEASEKQRMDLETLLDDARRQGQKELQGVIADKDKRIAELEAQLAKKK